MTYPALKCRLAARLGPAAGGFVFAHCAPTTFFLFYDVRRSPAGTAQERGIAPEELVSGSTAHDRHLDKLNAMFRAIHRPQQGPTRVAITPGLGNKHALRPVLSLRSLFGC